MKKKSKKCPRCKIHFLDDSRASYPRSVHDCKTLICVRCHFAELKIRAHKMKPGPLEKAFIEKLSKKTKKAPGAKSKK